jgi:hypothetical protein
MISQSWGSGTIAIYRQYKLVCDDLASKFESGTKKGSGLDKDPNIIMARKPHVTRKIICIENLEDVGSAANALRE